MSGFVYILAEFGLWLLNGDDNSIWLTDYLVFAVVSLLKMVSE
jgi:hypothetical protein